jgi:hypothetical protein
MARRKSKARVPWAQRRTQARQRKQIEFKPSNLMPGSSEKVQLMRERVAAGLPPCHPLDLTITRISEHVERPGDLHDDTPLQTRDGEGIHEEFEEDTEID